MLKCLKIPVEKLKAKEIDSVRERVTCLKWELGFTPPLERIKKSIQAGFATELGVIFEAGPLTASEEKLYQKKLKYYQSDEWIDLVKPKFKRNEVIQAAYKANAGMVRFTLLVNIPRKRIINIYITGDFLSFPSRALFDMEATLRGVPLERDYIHQTIGEFFADGRITIPGMTCSDFLKPLDLAIEKLDIHKYGIPLEYCNQLSVTNGTFDEIIKKQPSVLLLPYCSKLTTCDLRYKKSCRRCGECSIGPAWSLGIEKKMKVICITSFDDLMSELYRLKTNGVSAFIGCCCKPFFTKHFDDFETVGLPGIFLDIDNTTCYELDQAKAAYAGKFDSQTEVNLDLLNTLLNVAPA
jgi:lipoate-protein ligase A